MTNEIETTLKLIKEANKLLNDQKMNLYGIALNNEMLLLIRGTNEQSYDDIDAVDLHDGVKVLIDNSLPDNYIHRFFSYSEYKDYCEGMNNETKS